MTLDVSGESSGALVKFGSASRATARGFGFGVTLDDAVGVEVGVAAGSAMRRTALGVAVGVDGREGTAVFFARLLGVDGASVGTPSSAEADSGAFLLRGLAAEADGGGTTPDGASLPSVWAWAWALRRADRRLDIEVSVASVIMRAVGCRNLCPVARKTVEDCESLWICRGMEQTWKGRATIMRFRNE